MRRQPADTPPIACDLTSIPSAARNAHLALAQRLFGELRLETRELPDGLTFRFAADASSQLLEGSWRRAIVQSLQDGLSAVQRFQQRSLFETSELLNIKRRAERALGTCI